MSTDKTIGIQNSIRENSEELQTFFNDLLNWENEMKKKDREIINSRSIGESSEVNKCASETITVSKPIEKQAKRENNDMEEQEILRRKQRAIAFKDTGNTFFMEGLYDQAIESYTLGIHEDPENASLLANRAMAYLKIEEFKHAEDDCTVCLLLEDTYVKALLRRGIARFALKKYELAQKDFLKALEYEPKNGRALAELKKLMPFVGKATDVSELNQATKEKTIFHVFNKSTACNSASPCCVPVLPSVPEKTHQFSSDWRKLKCFPDLQYKYLRQFPAENFPILFQHSMEPDLFSGILKVICTSFMNNNDEVYSYLKFLSKVGRFQTLTMLLSANEIKDLSQLMNYIRSSKQCSDEEIDYVARLYKIM